MLGPVILRLRESTQPPYRQSLGEIEELANNTPGILDVPPFTVTGQAESYFDLFFEVEAGGVVMHGEQPARLRAMISHKPPRPNEVYLDLDPQPIDLVDINGNPTGVRVMNEALSPNPRILTALYPGHLKIDWAPIGVVPGTLESAPEATGPWADMPGAVPVYEAPITGERRFFRVRF